LPSRLAPPELKEVFPLGKSPILQDGDLTLAESGAIIGETYHGIVPIAHSPGRRLLNCCAGFTEYLITKYDGGDKFKAPSSGDSYVNNLYCMWFAACVDYGAQN